MSEEYSRREVLGAAAVTASGVLAGCNDDSTETGLSGSTKNQRRINIAKDDTLYFEDQDTVYGITFEDSQGAQATVEAGSYESNEELGIPAGYKEVNVEEFEVEDGDIIELGSLDIEVDDVDIGYMQIDLGEPLPYQED